MESLPVINDALAALAAPTEQSLAAIFASDCVFLLPPGPYRIDSLEEFAKWPKSAFMSAGGLHIRQPKERRIGRNTLVSFNWVLSPRDAAAPHLLSGFGTALVLEGKVIHLHLSINA